MVGAAGIGTCVLTDTTCIDAVRAPLLADVVRQSLGEFSEVRAQAIVAHASGLESILQQESQSDGRCNSSDKNENSRRQTNREVFASTAYSVRGYCGFR